MMRSTYSIFAVASLAISFTACTGPTPAPVPAATSFHAGISIQDVMESVIDPSADFIWGSVSTTVGAKGIEEKMPRSDAEWADVRRHSILLMEASNLLKVRGRPVARPGTKSTAPGIEEEPEGTKKLMDADMASWDVAADGLYDAAALLLKAADGRNTEAILEAGNTLDQACESCHLKYWYPNQTEILKKNAEEAAAEAAAKAKTK